MILKASQRSGAAQLGRHLLNAQDNEHVEVFDVRGFMAEDVMGAMRESEALAKGTRCKQHLFSVSLNPPENEDVPAEVFEGAVASIEEKMGLTDQPRMVIFHEKEGRRHAHAVWSRIDAETMTAKQLSFYKTKLQEVSKQLYLENGWTMPEGLADKSKRDPRNFTLDEWQQAKRAGLDAKTLKSHAQDAWAISDNRESFAHALEERGLYLAKGDRRGHVAVTYEGEVFALSRLTGMKAKDIKAKIGKPDDLRSVADTKKHIANSIAPRLDGFIKQAKTLAKDALTPLRDQRKAMRDIHAKERAKMNEGQKERWNHETKERAGRLRSGVRGLWDRMTGEHSKTVKRNELEAWQGLRRDRHQRQTMLEAQHKERRKLQTQFRATRERHSKQIQELHKQAANYCLMRDDNQQSLRDQFSRKSGQESRDNQQGQARPSRGLELKR
uniref:relaxase/mobilization nuclease domain-containing protein n=1 Tax=uncultured Erythrobacter sp. TaxID=263913 RepID=UPI002620C7DF|nr:relaxase [uncultured Erythrobacter sp.]